ncbi:cytochrome ubiquinol oxidase subunit I, partial [Saccharomonospora saliphila]|uniref:cytochrome ubiquinol oxidase subunit I n=1 Tax=Saccharomonospora saliphila TaxID=369829 RepID=UPI0006625260
MTGSEREGGRRWTRPYLLGAGSVLVAELAVVGALVLPSPTVIAGTTFVHCSTNSRWLATATVCTGEPRYFRMTKFWGKLLLVNFAMGVVTGIV